MALDKPKSKYAVGMGSDDNAGDHSLAKRSTARDSLMVFALFFLSAGFFVAANIVPAAEVEVDYGSFLSSLSTTSCNLTDSSFKFTTNQIATYLWDQGLHEIVIWLIIWAVVWPFLKCLLQLAAWFTPMPNTFRTVFLAVLEIFAHFSLVELLLLAVLMGGLRVSIDTVTDPGAVTTIFAQASSPSNSSASSRQGHVLSTPTCKDDPTGSMQAANQQCSATVLLGCDTDLSTLSMDAPKNTLVWHLCPTSCSKCTEWDTAAAAGDLAHIGVGSGGSTPSTPDTPSPPALVCKDDPTGAMQASNQQCSTTVIVGCDTDLSTLSMDIPKNTLVWHLCPTSCSKCTEWNTAAAAGDLAHIGVGSPPPALVCKDDPTGSVKTSGQTCATLNAVGCGIDLNTIIPSLPMNTLVWHLCPTTCSKCTEWDAAAAAGELVHIGVGSTPSFEWIECKDDAVGSLKAQNQNCAVVKPSCELDLSLLDNSGSTPVNTFGWHLCPETCMRCDTWKELAASGKLAHISYQPPASLPTCKDDPTGHVKKKMKTCTDDYSGSCQTDLFESEPGDFTTKGSFGWMICPLTCGMCFDWVHAAAAGNLTHVGVDSVPKTNAPSRCVDDITGVVQQQTTSGCAFFKDKCNDELKASNDVYPADMYGWMLCPVTCNKCADWETALDNGDLAPLSITNQPPPTPIPTAVCVDDYAKRFTSVGGCPALYELCNKDISDITPPPQKTESPPSPTAIPGTTDDIVCKDDILGNLKAGGKSCSEIINGCSLDISTVEPALPKNTFGYYLCPVSCTKCDEWKVKVAAGKLTHLGIGSNGLPMTPIPAGSSVCEDDPTKALKNSGQTCLSTSAAANCTTDLNTLVPTTPKGTFLWYLCPVYCNMCTEWNTAVAAGDLAHIGIGSDGSMATPSPPVALVCKDDPTGSMQAAGQQCSTTVLLGCDTDLSTLSMDAPKNTLVWHLCPTSCSKCTEWNTAAAAGGLAHIGVGSGGSTPSTPDTPSPPALVCKDDPTGSMQAANQQCSATVLVGCDTDLSTLSMDAPKNTLVWHLCPTSCSKCSEWNTAAAAGQLKHIGVGIPITSAPATPAPDSTTPTPPDPTLVPASSLTCKDDPLQLVANNNKACSDFHPVCAVVLQNAAYPQNTLGWHLCPVTCGKCTEWTAAAAAGDLVHTGIGPTSNMFPVTFRRGHFLSVPTTSSRQGHVLSTPTCKDDPTGSMQAANQQCSATVLLGCDTDLSTLSMDAPKNTLVWHLCPTSCSKCTEWDTAAAAGGLAHIGVGSGGSTPSTPDTPSPPALVCKDDPTGSLQAADQQCSTTVIVGCDTDLSTLSMNAPKNTLVWHLCPTSCSKCTEWNTAAAAGDLAHIGIIAPAPPAIAPCKDDPSGALAAKMYSCAILKTFCDSDLSATDASLPKDTYGWYLCPETCSKCPDWDVKAASGGLDHLGLVCKDTAARPVTKDVAACTAFNSAACEKDQSTVDSSLPSGTMGWQLCPVTCGMCTDFLQKYNAPKPVPGPSLTCEDDVTGALKAKMSSCSQFVEGCNDKLEKYGWTGVGNVWNLCPVTCKKCTEWNAAVAKDEFTHLGIVNNTKQCVDDVKKMTVAKGGCASISLGNCGTDLKSEYSVANTLYGWMLCPVSCGKCMEYDHVVASGALSDIGVTSAPSQGNDLQDIGWMTCPQTCGRCDDWSKMAANGSLEHIGIYIKPGSSTPSPTMECTDNAGNWFEAGKCAQMKNLCIVDVGFDPAFQPGTFGWMVCPVTCGQCDQWHSALASGNLAIIGLDPYSTPEPTNMNITLTFSFELVPAAGDYLYLVGTLLSVAWGSWMSSRWSSIRYNTIGQQATGLSYVGIVGVTMCCVVGFGLTFAGLYLSAYEWKLSGALAQFANDPQKEGSIIELATELMEDGDGRVVIGIILWVFVITIPLLLPCVAMSAAVLSSPFLVRITKILHPFAMADVIALSTLIVDQEIDKVLSKGILGDLDCIIADTSAFLSITSTSTVGTPLLILGVVISYIGVFCVTFNCSEHEGARISPIVCKRKKKGKKPKDAIGHNEKEAELEAYETETPVCEA